MVKQQPFVLVVEDDGRLRTAIARNLQANGYFVFEAGTFAEALDKMAVKPNLMILDINLPDASGWDVADWLKSATSSVPIIVISGLTPDSKKLDAFRPKAFLSKPFPIQDLMALVQQYAPIRNSECGIRNAE